MGPVKKKVSYVVRNFWDATRYYSRGLIARFVEDDVLFLASGIAFNVLLCIIPLLLLASSLLGIFLNSSDMAMANIDKFLTKALPNQAQAVAIKDLAFRIINDFVEFRRSLGVFGAIVLIYTSSSLFSSVRSALHRIHHVTTTTGIFISQLKDVILVLALGWLFISINTLNWLYTLISRYSAEMFGPNFAALQSTLPDFLARLTSFILTVLMAFLAYRFVPFYGTTTKISLISAVATTVLWKLVGYLFALYLTTFQPFRKVYGAYAFMFIAMVWVYFSCIVFVLGAAVGGLYKERKEISDT
ncbi:MAG TPA: YihY/virulence factor BrkB family protein [Bacteroidota bacterium]|nr:YihY/virulence factor BrkB family protein [Bacteroidota bacterium]